MAIKIGQGFKRASAAPIDDSLVLTKAKMLAADDAMMPPNYFCVCKDDGKLYLYDKSNDVDDTTGKYRVFEGGYDDTELRNAISTLERQKATGYFERTDFDIPLSTAGQPAFALAKDLFKIEVENHKPYTYEFTAGDVYNLAQYNETIGKTFIARNEDNETIHVKMTGPLPDNVQYAAVSSNPVLDFTNATATLTKTTFLKQIDEMLIPAAAGEVFIFDVNGDEFTEDPQNPGGKHYGTTITSPTFEEIMDNLVSDKLVFAKITYNNGNTSEIYQLFRTSANSIRGKAFDLEFPQGYIWFYDIYIQKRNFETTTYFGMFADQVSDGGGADFQIAHIPGGGGTGEEVKAILSKDADNMSVSYYKDAELPNTVNMSVGEDTFEVPTKGYVDMSAGVFVLDADNPCSYNALQVAINAPKSVFVKFGGKFYPLVDKWENDEGSKRYVNLATLQRPTADKGVTYFFFEATIGNLESPMAYSSNYEQPYGKGYVDGKTGDLTTLTTDNKDNLVAAINEVYEKSGEPFRVKNWAANNLNATIVPCTSDASNTQLSKMTYSITGVEGESYQIVGMIAYEVFDAASGGNRINCWPVCQFTGNGQKELSVRWVCAGTTDKTAKRINAWVLLKHR